MENFTVSNRVISTNEISVILSGNGKCTREKSSAGLGLFANKQFKRGDLIIEYTGETISEEEVNRRGGKYLFELNDDWAIDGKGRDNIARYINHSCKPNCYPELNEEETRVFIYAKRKSLREKNSLTTTAKIISTKS